MAHADRVGIVSTKRGDTLEFWVDDNNQLSMRSWDNRFGVRADVVLDEDAARNFAALVGAALVRLSAGPEAAEDEPAPAGAGGEGVALQERAEELAGRVCGQSA